MTYDDDQNLCSSCRLHMARYAAEARREAEEEIKRLRGCLAKANAGVERFEREMYLATNRAEKAEEELRDVRADALEEAATIADGYRASAVAHGWLNGSGQAEDIADEIRALKERP